MAVPDALRAWISRNTSVPLQRQILMTARGKPVKLQSLAMENEIFVYDRNFIVEQGSTGISEIPSPEPFTPDHPPDTLANQNSLQAWKDLYNARRSWALNLTAKCGQMAKAAHQHDERIDVIHRSVGAALENLKSHVGSLEQKLQEAQTWANDLLREQQLALGGWQRSLAQLETIPAEKQFAFLRRPETPKVEQEACSETLQDYVDAAQTKRSAAQVSAVCAQLSRKMESVEDAVGDIAKQTEELERETQPPPIIDVDGVMQEIETVAKKIISDYEHVLGLPNTTKTLSIISRMALNHTEDLLPSLAEFSLEIHSALVQSVKNRNHAMTMFLQYMPRISAIESRFAAAQAEIAALDVDGDAFDTLCMVFHIPIVYGSVLIEAVRRREWSDKMKTDSSTFAEELASFRDEEQRRRKKWIKNMGDFLTVSEDSTPNVEVNLQAGKGSEWPQVSRTDIETYMQNIKSKDGLDLAVQELTQLYKDLDAPTRQQRRKAKAFKHGSVIEMGSSFFMRGDEAVRSLKDEKTRLEDKLKSSESRVRRLEDLLHRSSHMSRPVSGNFGSDFPISPASPRPDAVSRRSSISSRRMSANNAPEEKSLVQRIAALESELLAEREIVSKLKQEAQTERQSTIDRMEEVQSTNKDLMHNLEAKQREFENERKFLESEADKFKIRLEELEEELDRTMDARDHEKSEAKAKSGKLQSELTKALTSVEEAKELRMQVQNLQAQSSKFDIEKKELSDRIDHLTKQEKEHIELLQAAHRQLSPRGAAPSGFSQLVQAIEVLSEGLAIHAKGSDGKATELSEENQVLSEKVCHLESEIDCLKQNLEAKELERTKTLESYSHTKEALLEAQSSLENEHSRLKTLESKLSTGESGTEVLKDRIAEEEQKVAMLTEKLAAIDSKAQNIGDERQEWETRSEQLKRLESNLKSHLAAKSTWADEISKRLYTQIEVMAKMLQQLGFTIVFQDSEMTVQRTSKVVGNSVLAESIASSGILPAIENPDVLLWTQAADRDEESAKFDAFMTAVSRFDLESFAEAVVKRVKDIETVARKWQKEARAYRDKYHRAQSDSHDKIAYRSFKEGDLALFLPTRNQAIRSWAAFNVGAPHYFLREQDAHRLHTRDWLLARISKIDERVVDLSKAMNGMNPDKRSIDASDGASIEDDNPFELSDGLRWYLLDASEEKAHAPSTPGLGKSTVASAHVDARGSIRLKRPSNGGGATKTLARSLDSRRNSSASKKGAPGRSLLREESSTAENRVVSAEGDPGAQPRREEAPIFDQVRKDLFSGPSNLI
ncbi:oligomeric, coiled-coil, peripheral membrane protein [Ophidiomyces ophidiicola]|nr:oligomeric, coiled-coil, peripheral membrane protein [Ophidiomyces ophidiicola]KAI2077270.1 oligomeric, coiled-coil, peripheral membrane protein [Ophidiomyces ophidiicola]KAI2137227.1 oligomeric, coiled-coil, peripheral membrane protein [Ophidiomyces ophidiicola]KAI2139565.1 oligomeric, coiled-coil, peripheral membrane protein [Ophidiomyces ophidiicola]KAI2220908.1 oligomeric, coiled-coil, peripheral membrane protein [Ophidiomyces ophidiicola]